MHDIGDVKTANRDVHVAADLVENYSALKQILTDRRFTQEFDRYDSQARRAKALYTATGVSSVFLAIAALEFGVFTLAENAVGSSVAQWASLVFSFMAVGSLLLIIWGYLTNLRRQWLLHVFVRERLRQWRHQVVLDGSLMDLSLSDPISHKKALDDRWARFLQDIAIGGGKFDAYIGKPGADQYWLIAPSIPRQATVLSQIVKLQESLRVDYQLSFAEGKRAAGASNFGIAEITGMADWAATTTLVVAVALNVALFVAQLFNVDAHQHYWIVSLAGIAVGLAIASLGLRAIRAGLTIPDERESYDDYSNRCQVLAEMFRKARNDDAAQWHILVELERSAAEELRRFLRIKRDSRFIF